MAVGILLCAQMGYYQWYARSLKKQASAAFVFLMPLLMKAGKLWMKIRPGRKVFLFMKYIPAVDFPETSYLNSLKVTFYFKLVNRIMQTCPP